MRTRGGDMTWTWKVVGDEQDFGITVKMGWNVMPPVAVVSRSAVQGYHMRQTSQSIVRARQQIYGFARGESPEFLHRCQRTREDEESAYG